ncbi:MAG: hypothetical protein QF583_04570, partial [Rhodospirillales bacterium]|nr:hypothetical protein [Rhodospirillales bacterium]HJP54856.1 hypothetical protein [Rhodospirillales bacterium]
MRQTAIDEWLHAYGDIGTCFRYSWLMSVSGWCRKVGGKLENWRKLLIVKHSERRFAAAKRSLRHGTSYSIDVAAS